MQRRSSFWEHEALANYWGQEHFNHPSCVTDCILKTKEERRVGNRPTIKVYAYGYRSVKRLSYIRKLGSGGNLVYWDEYFPVTGQGKIRMMEDNNIGDIQMSHQERMRCVDEVLSGSDLKVYCRHIAYKI